MELRGEYVEKIHFFNLVACCFLYKAKDLSAPPCKVKAAHVFAYCTVKYLGDRG
jgi:hypothetical protein